MKIALSIAALIAAVAFAVLVISLVVTFNSIRRTMERMTGTIENLEKQVAGITYESTELLKKTNKLADDINNKSLKLNTVFDGINEIGLTVQDFNHSLSRIQSKLTKAAEKDQDKTSQAVKWGMAIFDMIKNKRKK